MADRLNAQLSEHLRLHLLAYGEASIKPKHHWNMDVGEQLRRDDLVLDTFVIERGHLQVKSVAENVRQTGRFERSVLAGVLNLCMKPEAKAGTSSLHGQVQHIVDHTWVSAKLTCFGMQIAVGDMVFRGPSCGLVVACVLMGGELSVVVDVFAPVAQSMYHGTWRDSGASENWPASDLQPAVAWKTLDRNVVLVLR